MRTAKLRAGKFPVDEALVQRLVATQFPHWGHLPARVVPLDGWDNWTFRLGADRKVRLPSAAPYALQVEKEARWLPELAAHLPLSVPTPLATGEPGEGYPWRWCIYDWLAGEPATRTRIRDLPQFAMDLGTFLTALWSVDTTGGPVAGEHSFYRGGDLAVYASEVRQCIESLQEKLDATAALATWEAALAAEPEGPPVWVHGDIAAGNLLVTDGKLTGVIDFGAAAVGDRACDLVIAWVFFDGKAREAFRQTVAADSGTWARARGWALWKALLLHARGLNQHPAEFPARTVIEAVLAEHATV
ncbi:MAG: aminoglycoside phosphotransferase family protein [Armatimonadetes bacterium]|nr:aminoglycoside phosphotransferase family protein [Armatimonadota bacterium]